jgi:restriction endonuclease Mrr
MLHQVSTGNIHKLATYQRLSPALFEQIRDDLGRQMGYTRSWSE